MTTQREQSYQLENGYYVCVAQEGRYGCEVEYTISEEGYITVVDVRYTKDGVYANDLQT